MTRLLNAVTLLGAGAQGSRLAYMWSRIGRPVYLVDKSPTQLGLALATVQRLRASNPPSEPGQVISLTADNLDKALHNSWLAIECVPEDLVCKRPVMVELDRKSDPETIIASNSSSYSISDICKGLRLRAHDRFVNLHSGWSPIRPYVSRVTGLLTTHESAHPRPQVIEIMGSSQTRADIIPLLMKETQDHGFQPFHVRKSSTGYTFNRCLANHVVWDSAIHTNHV